MRSSNVQIEGNAPENFPREYDVSTSELKESCYPLRDHIGVLQD